MRRSLAKYRYYLWSIAQLLMRFRNPVLIVRIFTGTAGRSVHTVEVRKLGLRFDVRDVQDVWSVKEATVDRFYERYGYPIRPGLTVVDVGAGIGEFVILAAALDARNKVFAFEPNPESFALMQDNIRQNSLWNVLPFPEAVSGIEGVLTLDFGTAGGDPLQVSTRNESAGTISGQDTISAISLASVVDRTDAHRIDLLKLDCEGAEYDILMCSSAETLEHVDRIVMEYHDKLTVHTHVELEELLVMHGYAVESFPNVVHPDQIGYLRASR